MVPGTLSHALLWIVMREVLDLGGCEYTNSAFYNFYFNLKYFTSKACSSVTVHIQLQKGNFSGDTSCCLWQKLKEMISQDGQWSSLPAARELPQVPNPLLALLSWCTGELVCTNGVPMLALDWLNGSAKAVVQHNESILVKHIGLYWHAMCRCLFQSAGRYFKLNKSLNPEANTGFCKLGENYLSSRISRIYYRPSWLYYSFSDSTALYRVYSLPLISSGHKKPQSELIQGCWPNISVAGVCHQLCRGKSRNWVFRQ